MLGFGLGLGLEAKIFGIGLAARGLGLGLALPPKALALYPVALLTSLMTDFFNKSDTYFRPVSQLRLRLRHDYDEKLTCSFFARVESHRMLAGARDTS